MKKLVIIALVLAIATGFGSYRYLTKIENTHAYPTKNVVVAKIRIPEHIVITAEMVQIKSLAEDAVNSLSESSLDSVIGKVSENTIEADEQILTTKLITQGGKDSELSYELPTGCRALTIATDGVSGVAGQIKIGDHVDIMAVLPETGASGKIVKSSEYIAQNLKVIAVGLYDGTGASNSLVTVSVPATDLPVLYYKLSQGTYRLVLRSVVDTQPVAIPAYVSN